MMKKIIIFALVTVTAVIAIVVTISLLNPLRRQTQEEILRNVLEITPIGMNMEEVLEVIEREDWELWNVNHYHGFIRRPTDPEDFALGRETIIGVKSISACLGTYIGGHGRIFHSYTGVTVRWGFDENSILIDVIVLKETDAP